MIRRILAHLLLPGLLLGSSSGLAAQDAGPKPRLFVIVSIDQMRGDYVERYGHMWTKGLRRLVDGGARFSRASYPYMNTVTCAGHATIGTGTYPATHGMVLNQWWDRATQKLTTCTDDDTVKPVHVNGTRSEALLGNSGRRLLAPTFADELRAQSAVPPRIVSLSLKPRSAIGMAGHRGNLVLWFSSPQGWTTSEAFGGDPQPWLAEFLKTRPIEADYGKSWTRLLPDGAYVWADNGVGEGTPNGWTREFPHAIASKSGKPDEEFVSMWEDTPMADAALTAIGMEAVSQMRLGQDEDRRDVLAISYSVLDHVGHAYGPRSHEVQDVLARLDVTIGDLLDHLDRKVGREHYVLAMTGDHGVSPIPEQMSTLGLDAGRVSLGDLRARVDKALEPFFGPGPHVAALAYTDLYFVAGRYEAMQGNPEAMRAAIAALQAVPSIARVYRGDLIAAGVVPDEPLARSVAAGYHPARSGDLLLVPRPYWITSSSVATHGTAYEYDARVPLVFYGGGIRPGVFVTPASPADLAVTFAHIAGVTLPQPEGDVRSEAFGGAAQPVRQTATRSTR